MTYASPAPLTFSADRLAGKVVFVTGASSGIGAAAVRRFAAEGALVAAAARRADRLAELVAQVRADGGGAQRPLHQIDAGKFDSVVTTNLRGPFLCIKHQIPHLIDRGGGSIVVTSSIGGLVGGRPTPTTPPASGAWRASSRARHSTTRPATSGSTPSRPARPGRRCSTGGCTPRNCAP